MTDNINKIEQVILHIGISKTGTKYLQTNFLY